MQAWINKQTLNWCDDDDDDDDDDDVMNRNVYKIQLSLN